MPRPELSFAAEYDGLRSVSIKVKRTRANEFICAPSIGGQLHVTGHGDGNVHLAFHDGDERAYYQQSPNDRTDTYPAVSYVFYSAGCKYPTDKPLTHITELPNDTLQAFYRVNYVPSGRGLVVPDGANWQRIGTIPLSDGEVWVNACRVHIPLFKYEGSGFGIASNRPDAPPLPPGFLSSDTEQGLFMLFGEYEQG